MNTVIVIEQTRRTTHKIKIRGAVSEEQMDTIANKLAKIDHPDDMAGIVSRLGLEVIEVDTEGCWEGSTFEWRDDRQEED